jgi:hypothetical protein
MSRRVVGFLSGLVYALGYGFFTMLVTGGGHGNFLWLMAFLVTFFGGIFFPVAGFLVADLRQVWARTALTVVLFLNLFATIFLFVGFLDEDGWQDISESWGRSAFLFVFMSIAHILPVAILWITDLRELTIRDSISGEYK